MHRDRNSPHSAYNSLHRGCHSPHSTCASYIEAVTSYIEDITAHIDVVTANIETVTSHIEAATAHTASGIIKPPFEPTATAPEKMAKPFFQRGFTPSDPHRLLNSRFGNRVNCFGNRVKVCWKPDKLFLNFF